MMRKLTMAASVAATLFATATALADDDETQSENQSQTQSQSYSHTQSQPQPAAPVVTSTTTTTSADPTVTPMGTTVAPPTRETTTIYQQVRPNKAYLYTGGGLFLGSYATTAALTGAAAVDDNPNVDRNLYIPVVGPWLHLANSDATAPNSTTDTILVAGSGVLQGAGLGLMIASLFVPERVPAATIQAGTVKVNVTPMAFGRGSSGFGAVGSF